MSHKKQTQRYLLVTIILTVSLLYACTPVSNQLADVIYSGGNIITMVDSQPGVEAIAVKDGKIIAVGAKTNVLKFKNAGTRMVNLNGKTLLPGFIDAHGHFGQVGLLAQVANVAAPPDGNSIDIATILKNLKAHANTSQAKEMGWILGMNYDDSQLTEKEHPTAKDLDKVSIEVPVLIIHQSGHLGVINTKAMEVLGYDESTPNPEGGALRRIDGSNKPNGVLEETALFVPVLKVITAKSEETLLARIRDGQKAYVAAGFTTAQEGRATPDNIKALGTASSKGLLDIDVVAYPGPDFYGDDEAFKKMMRTEPRSYSNHYRIGGIKLSLDGSPQGKTAWLKDPYYVPPQGQDADYRGYPAMKTEVVEKYVDMAFSNKWQVLVHSNGDAASDQFIAAVSKAKKAHSGTNVRPVIIHAQIIREDQLDAMKELNVIPSFMSVHTFYWGDWHRDSVLGKERAVRISPAQSALARNMLYTSHNDAPVTLPNAMMILSSQVNRTTRSGKVLGEEQRVSVMDALKSITINAAYQYFEEGSKGSLETGKVADLVILDKNPLTISPMTINDINVIETIKDGKTVYLAP